MPLIQYTTNESPQKKKNPQKLDNKHCNFDSCLQFRCLGPRLSCVGLCVTNGRSVRAAKLSVRGCWCHPPVSLLVVGVGL